MKWLAPLGWLYSLLMSLRVWLFQKGFLASHRLPGKVISVGNLEVGGTGKSPVVIALAEYLLAQGQRPAILTRGYRSGLARDESLTFLGSQILQVPQRTQRFHADEARMQAQKLGRVPVVVGAKRWAAAKRYLQSYPCPTHWLLDDGFQHLTIHRDLDVVLLDAGRPFDNGLCIPAGRLREPVRALRRAHFLFLTRSHPGVECPELKRLQALQMPFFKVFFKEAPPQQLAGPVIDPQIVEAWGLALGIARPERVRESLKSLGIKAREELIVGDHQSFSQEDLGQLAQKSDALLTTEKDYWRSPEAFAELQKPIFVLPLTVSWDEALSLSNLFKGLT